MMKLFIALLIAFALLAYGCVGNPPPTPSGGDGTAVTQTEGLPPAPPQENPANGTEMPPPPPPSDVPALGG